MDREAVILQAAREVFVAEPSAPLAAVAARAGVTVGALRGSFATKEALLQRLAADGLARSIAAAEAALADEGDPWRAFAGYLGRLVEEDTHAVTVRLTASFTPTEELLALAGRAQGLTRQVFEGARSAGALRPDFHVRDVPMLLEQLAAVHVDGLDRTRAVRRRYLALLLDALQARNGAELPGPPPTWGELASRWSR